MVIESLLPVVKASVNFQEDYGNSPTISITLSEESDSSSDVVYDLVGHDEDAGADIIVGHKNGIGFFGYYYETDPRTPFSRRGRYTKNVRLPDGEVEQRKYRSYSSSRPTVMNYYIFELEYKLFSCSLEYTNYTLSGCITYKMMKESVAPLLAKENVYLLRVTPKDGHDNGEPLIFPSLAKDTFVFPKGSEWKAKRFNDEYFIHETL